VCGISVIVDRTAAPGLAEALGRMDEAVRHRGPDGEGALLIDRQGRWRRLPAAGAAAGGAPLVGMAVRRLKIRDLTDAAAQPLGSRDGSRWLAFNGEIYNFRELRDELGRRGHHFRTAGDTEVVLAAFEEWDEGCFDRLDGMWALVVADLGRRRLVVSRDRFGIKPLYWHADGERLYLASEIRQILRVRGDRPRAEAGLVGRFLRGTRLPFFEETFFAGIRPVPPATWFEVPLDGDGRSPDFRRYWDLAAFRCEDGGGRQPEYAGARRELRDLLAAAVTSHALADVPVGSLLSGGLDSSTIVGFLADGRPLPTFSFGFRDAAPRHCELAYVDRMVSRHRLLNHETTLDAAGALEHAPRAIRALEEPPMGLPAVAQYRIFQLCREQGATVVLDGQGADEIFAGYEYHQRALLLDRLRKGRLREFLRELRAIEQRQLLGDAAVVAGYVLRPALRALRPGYGWLAPGYGAGAGGARPPGVGQSTDPSLVNRRLHYDVRWGNAKIMLGYSDKNAMAHSVEARVPYFDRKLVEFAFSLPDTFKVGHGERKRILRDVARDRVPPEITERRDRMGFALPDGELIRGMWPAVRARVDEDGFLRQPCIRPAALRRFLDDFERGRHQDARAVWRLYALAVWIAEFDVVL
jgi:asparagine synthase (glutamine-hydrolysing)